MLNDADTLILAALAKYSFQSSFQLAEITGLWSGDLYPAIMRLESEGKIVSEWEDLQLPRRRRYRLAEQDKPPEPAT